MELVSKLSVAEMFYSLQLEGVSLGTPSVFLRLAGCNLGCPGYPCDSENLWRNGSSITRVDLVEQFSNFGWIEKLRNGAHLIYSGGEPLLHMEKLCTLSKYIFMKSDWIFIEVETNGTILPSTQFDLFIQQYNVSPKLSNSHEPLEKRYIPEVIKWFSTNRKVFFKFVITNDEDIRELKELFINPFDISNNRIFLMPCGSTHEELKDKSKWLIEICKRDLFMYSPRMQVHIYDKTVGV